jgi:glycosyltransferase involved in cell wall biosynthesis
VVTVTPPTPSGVADHSARLIEAIAGDEVDADVEVFTSGGPRRLDRAAAVEVRHIAALPERVASDAVDDVLYCVGNDSIHRPLFDLMRIVPGHVLMHDVRIPRLYGPEGPPEGAIPDADSEHVSTPVASVAVSRLVQSEHASTLLREVSGFDSIDVGPHPCWNDGTVDPIDDGDPPWIVSVGIAHEVKRTDLFVAAIRHLTERVAVRAAVVGPGGSRFVGGSDVVATEHVDDVEFDAWLRKAAIAVQLRATTNGESSGAVANVIARGVPLIVTDIGAMSELPDDVAVRVPVDVTAEHLADVMAALLGDPEARGRMRSAALAFAGRETVTAQALRIVGAVRPAAGVRG